MKLTAGDRVRVSGDIGWANDATGTITVYPSLVSDLMTGELETSETMSVPTRSGPSLEAWVVFDTPQNDPDGDGPYMAAMIAISALDKVPE